MARTLTRAQQTYPAGAYGPFAIDSLTREDTERIEAVLTNEVVAGRASDLLV